MQQMKGYQARLVVFIKEFQDDTDHFRITGTITGSRDTSIRQFGYGKGSARNASSTVIFPISNTPGRSWIYDFSLRPVVQPAQNTAKPQ